MKRTSKFVLLSASSLVLVPLIGVLWHNYINSNSYKLEPALYIFGDSTVDSGNIHVLNNEEAIPPYGVDLPNGFKGNRMTNGLNVVDYLAKFLGRQAPPPYLLFDLKNETTTLEGVNYACGSSGILDITRMPNYVSLSFRQQLENFKRTIEEYLPRRFKDKTHLINHLSRSIFLVGFSAGNDYPLNFYDRLTKQDLDSNNQITEFTDHLILQLGNYLQELFELGARKVVVSEIVPIGCMPMIYLVKGGDDISCDATTNERISDFNRKLVTMLQELTQKLEGSAFVLARSYDLIEDLVDNPSRYGLTHSRHPCCEVYRGQCTEHSQPCENRSFYVFFDAIHFTEAIHKIFATKFLNEKNFCTPVSFQELLHK